MPAASDKGSQPYSRAYGYGEMAGARIAPNNISLPLGRRHEQSLSLTYSISFHCNTTQNLSPFRGSVNGCVLSRGSVLRTSPPACILVHFQCTIGQIPYRSPLFWSCPSAMRRCQRHRTKVASHTVVPLGTANQRSLFAKRGKVNGWEGRTTHPETLPIGKGHTQPLSPTQGQADIIGATLAPAISQPQEGQLYGWLPLSNAYGIPSLATKYII